MGDKIKEVCEEMNEKQALAENLQTVRGYAKKIYDKDRNEPRLDIVKPHRRFESEHELVYAEGISGLKEQKVVMLIFNDILLLARPKVENNWKLLAEFELGSLHVDDHRSSDIPEQEFAIGNAHRDLILRAGSNLEKKQNVQAIEEAQKRAHNKVQALKAAQQK